MVIPSKTIILAPRAVSVEAVVRTATLEAVVEAEVGLEVGVPITKGALVVVLIMPVPTRATLPERIPATAR